MPGKVLESGTWKAIRSWLLGLALAVLVPSGALGADIVPPEGPANKLPSPRVLAEIRREVETLRGKKFRREVPVSPLSEKELRALVEREIAKEYPGRKLADYQDLMAWLDLFPTNTDLKAVYSAYLVDQGAGLYDSDTKELRIPSPAQGKRDGENKSGAKKRETLDPLNDPRFLTLVFAHEYTHALEDQYWPLDDPEEKNSQASTDASVGRSFLVEGSATRLMLEAVPGHLEGSTPGSYVWTWKVLHSGVGETVLDFMLGRLWKSSDADVPGVPETLTRSELMAYAYGYSFCTKVLRHWGLDGLDYIYDHPPVSSEQVMDAEKCWEWRDFPVQIGLPETLPGDWKKLTGDTLGEAGMAVLFGCQLKNLNRGSRLARGWDGDRAALYEGPGGRRLLVWASSWDSTLAAERYVQACVEVRRAANRAATVRERRGHNHPPALAEARGAAVQAAVTRGTSEALTWTRPDGRAGMLLRQDKRVILFETDQPEALSAGEAWARTLTFTDPPEDATRAAANHLVLRFNPLLSWRQDGNYAVTKALSGLLWRHDQNSIGAADLVLLGVVGEWRRTSSFKTGKLAWGLAVTHESEARRGFTKTSLLPGGVLFSHFSSVRPQSPTHTISRSSVLWGLAGSRTSNGPNQQAWRILPGGLLFRSTTGSGKTAVHVLGTGLSRSQGSGAAGLTTRFRLLGIPVWTQKALP